MATYYVNIDTLDSEGIKALGVGVPPQVERGDTVIFQYTFAEGIPTTVSVFGLDSNVWTVSTGFSLTEGQSVTRFIRSDASLITDTISFSASGYTTQNRNIQVISSVDTTPDQFTFADITQANPSEERFSNLIQITGINTGVTASISGNSAQFNVNGGTYSVFNKTVNNGDTIQVKMNASSTYSSTVSTTLTVSGVSDVWSITTRTDPGSGQIINFPKTVTPINQSDVINFFGGSEPLFRQPNLRAYLKGGTFVPNISQNAAIPTSGNLALTNFLGSATSLYFTSFGSSQIASANTIPGPQSLSLTWIVGAAGSQNPSIGYGNIRFSCQYYWTLSEDTSLDTGVSISAGAGTWSSDNLGVTLSASAPQNSERTYMGTLTLYVRSSYDTSKVLSTSFGYNFSFLGP